MLTEAPPLLSPSEEFRLARIPESNILDLSLLAAITLIAAVLRLHGLSAKSIWFDEAMSAEIARLPWSQFASALWNREANMALYYLLLHFWLALGATPGFIRGLSVVFSVATVPVIGLLGTRLFGRKTGLIAAWLLSINAYHIRYAQEARSYALLVFLSALATLFFVWNLQEPSRAHWDIYTALCVLAVCAHFFGGLVVLAHAASLLFVDRNRLPWPALKRCLSWFCACMVPIAAFVVHAGPGPLNWIPRTAFGVVAALFISMAGNYGLRLLVADTVAACVAGFVAYRLWNKNGHPLQVWSHGLAVSLISVPIATTLIVSVAHPLFVPRYLNPCLIGLILLVAAGIACVPSQAIASVLVALISVFSLLGTASYYRQDFDMVRDRWDSATTFVFDHARPGDGAFFFLNFTRVPFEFYRTQRNPVPWWPEALSSQNGLGLTDKDFVFQYLGDELRDARPPADRVWLILQYDEDPDGKPNRASIMLRSVYGNGRHLIEAQKFSGITVLLYSRDSTNPSPPAGNAQ